MELDSSVYFSPPIDDSSFRPPSSQNDNNNNNDNNNLEGENTNDDNLEEAPSQSVNQDFAYTNTNASQDEDSPYSDPHINSTRTTFASINHRKNKQKEHFSSTAGIELVRYTSLPRCTEEFTLLLIN